MTMPALRIDGIRHALLDPIALTLAAGELVFLSGPSGAGKSLLLRAIADLDPHQGEVWLGSQARSTLSAPEWRRRVGMLPAESAWWSERVGEHFPSSSEPSNRHGEPPPILHWLQRLGFGIEVMDWSVSRLSTGERQRLGLLRMLAQQPQALLLDEATANLDPLNRDRVEALIEDYRHNALVPVLWVSHDIEQRRRLGARRFIIHDRRLEPEP